MFNRVFGKKKQKAPTKSLGEVGKNVDGRVEHLEKKIMKEEKELIALKKRIKRSKGPAQARLRNRAKLMLRRKKQFERQRDQLMQTSFNIEQQAFTLQNIKDTQETVAAMKETMQVTKVEMKKVNIDEVEDLMDEVEDNLEDAEELQELMGRSYGNMEDVDECDLDAELDALGDELDELDEIGDGEAIGDEGPSYLQDAAEAASLPDAPASVPSSEGVTLDEYGLPAKPAAAT